MLILIIKCDKSLNVIFVQGMTIVIVSGAHATKL